MKYTQIKWRKNRNHDLDEPISFAEKVVIGLMRLLLPPLADNVGHFMADLITDNDIWQKWEGQMPLIYNKVSE